MRVVAGRFGGRRLKAPPGRDTRPTSDRVREALFSTLGPLDGARVLDLCPPEAEVHAGPARAALRSASARGDTYDLIFLDPPYRSAPGLGRELSAALEPLLTGGGRVVSESDRRAPLELDLPLTHERRYGDTLIRIHGT